MVEVKRKERRLEDRAHHRAADRSEHVEQEQKTLPCAFYRFPNRREPWEFRTTVHMLRFGLSAGFSDCVEEAGVPFRQAGYFQIVAARLQFASKTHELPGSKRVKGAKPRHVDMKYRLPVEAAQDRTDSLIELVRVR